MSSKSYFLYTHTDILSMQIITLFLCFPYSLGHYTSDFPLKLVYTATDFYLLLLEKQQITSETHLVVWITCSNYSAITSLLFYTIYPHTSKDSTARSGVTLITNWTFLTRETKWPSVIQWADFCILNMHYPYRISSELICPSCTGFFIFLNVNGIHC